MGGSGVGARGGARMGSRGGAATGRLAEKGEGLGAGAGKAAATRGAATGASPRALQPYLPLGVSGYRELAVRSATVELAYSFRSEGDGAFPLAVPDGCVDLAVGVGSSDVVVTIGGTVLAAKGWGFSGGRTWTGVRFRPGEAVLPRGVGPADLVDADLALEEGALDGRLVEELAGTEDARARMAALVAHFSAPGRAGEAARGLERFCRERILSSGGTVAMSAVAEEAGVTLRHLRRAFGEVHGFPPKTFSRFVRFQRAMCALATAGDAASAQRLAVSCGYSDQSHLVHEFDEFAGTSPARFRRLVLAAG